MEQRAGPLPDQIMQAAQEATEIFMKQAEEATAEMEKDIPDLEGVEL